MRPTTTAIIPTFNRRRYIRRAVDSVLRQTVPADEIIIIDDGSTDGTAGFLESEYGARLRVVQQKNAGVSGARSRGIQEAQGEWIAFLDSDDEWTPEHNERLLEAAAKVPQDVAWIFGDLQTVTDKGDWPGMQFEVLGFSVKDSPHLIDDPLTTVAFPFRCYLWASLIRRNALLEFSCFNSGLRAHEDVLAAYQVALHYRFAAIPSVVVRHYRTSDLAKESLSLDSMFGADRFRMRMIAYGLIAESGRKGPWRNLYVPQVRLLCRALARSGEHIPKTLPFSQFRFGNVSAKCVAFCVVALFGRRGVLLWDHISELREKALAPKRKELVGNWAERG